MILSSTATLFDWNKAVAVEDIVAPWKPVALNKEQWPPNYKAVYAWRMKALAQLEADPELLANVKRYYAKNPADFIMDWMDTYNPRKSPGHSDPAKNGPKWMPFVFFHRQLEYIQFLEECLRDAQNGLIEKCRDGGLTWTSCGYSVHKWLFVDSMAIGWGSRKQDLVDKLGNPDSIFEKMRLILRRMPRIFLPNGYDEQKHATFMRFVNPDNGSVIMGEAGDNIGRGGRTTMYFKDESAHYERPEKIEAALGDNTDIQIDISSVNGLGNVFHNRREAGIEWFPNSPPVQRGYTRVFIVDWSDHPEKTQDWYDERKAKAVREGLQHLFAQEVDRNYAASISNAIIDSEWIKCAIDAHKRIKWVDENGNHRVGFNDDEISNNWGAGLDVADDGIDRNGLCLRQWIIVRDIEEWGDRDVGVTARRAIVRCQRYRGIQIQYDCIGIGAGVKAEYNRLVDDKVINPDTLQLVPWNAGSSVVNPIEYVIPDDDQSPLNRDFFHNMKAQAWWSLRTRFYKTFKNITEGVLYPPDELISLDSRMKLLQQLIKELAQPTRGQSSLLKMIVDKKPDGTKSPNLGDCTVEAFFPIDQSHSQVLIGRY